MSKENPLCFLFIVTNQPQKPGNSCPESSVDLRGAQLQWTNDLSSKKNVFKVRHSKLDGLYVKKRPPIPISVSMSGLKMSQSNDPVLLNGLALEEVRFLLSFIDIFCIVKTVSTWCPQPE